MLSGKGKEKGEKKVYLAQKQLCTCSTIFCTFLCRYFARLQRETSKTSWLHVLWRKFRTGSCSLSFFTVATFHPVGSYKIWCCSSNKKCLLRFFSLALVLLLVALHWPVALRSHFRRLSLSLYSKFVDMTINLSLILYITRTQKHFPLSIFVFIDSFVVLASQDAGGHIVCFPAKITQHLASAYMRCVYGQVGGQAYAMS